MEITETRRIIKEFGVSKHLSDYGPQMQKLTKYHCDVDDAKVVVRELSEEYGIPGVTVAVEYDRRVLGTVDGGYKVISLRSNAPLATVCHEFAHIVRRNGYHDEEFFKVCEEIATIAEGSI